MKRSTRTSTRPLRKPEGKNRVRHLFLESLEQRTLMATLAPSLVTPTVASASEVNLTWELSDDLDTGIVIERRLGNSGLYQTLATLPGGEHTFTDTSLWASTSYQYRLKTQSDTGDSPYSSVVTVSTQAVGNGALAVVTDLKATAISSSKVTISFTDPNTLDNYRSYILERSSDGVSYQVVSVLDKGTSWTDVGLTPGATYSYRVHCASYIAPTSDYSKAAVVTLLPRTQGAPIDPSALTESNVTAHSATLNWVNNDLSNPQFKIERALFDQWHPMEWSQVGLTAAGATSFTDTGLDAETPYAYRVSAVNAVGASNFATPSNTQMRTIFGDGVGVVTASAGTGQPKTYNIGPGQTYQMIADLDWTKLGPGDTVNIHYKAGGYHELFQISTRGTALDWITINGIPDPVTGALPIIDGDQAILAPQFVNHYAPLSGSGVVTIGARPDYISGYKPGYLLIQNLQFQSAYSGNSNNTFTDFDGSTKSYDDFSAGIYLERADHVTIKGCIVTNNGNGIFGAGQSGFDRLMTDITLDSNYIYGNGVISDTHEHNTYLEGINTVYQFNHYGPTRTGAWGAGLKDRSVGLIIRNNYIEGGAHQLQLPESQNQIETAIVDPNYHKTFVYGNILVAPPSSGGSSLIWYGGDQGLDPFNRKGVLYLYGNTLIARSDQADVYKINAVDLSTSGETLDARNNIFVAIPNSSGSTHSDLGLLGNSNNNAYFGTNWVIPTYYLTTFNDYTFSGHVAGLANFLEGTSDDPGFVNLAGGDYHLSAGSVAIDAAGRLAGFAAQLPIDQEYLAPSQSQSRPVIGAASDLGAYEYRVSGGDTIPPDISAVVASSVSTSMATIAWTTNEPADAQVEYGTSTSYGTSSSLNNSLVTSHSVGLTGLSAGTTYHYRVRSRDAAGNLAVSDDFTFTPLTIRLSNQSIAETSPTSTVVGTLSAVDGNSSKAHTYTLVDSAGGRFKIVGNQVKVANGSLLDYEDSASHDIVVKVSSSGGPTYQTSLTILLTNVNEIASFDVQKGLSERSYINSVDLIFESDNALSSVLPQGRIKLTRYDLDGTSNPTQISLSGRVNVSGKALSLNFGAQGIGGNRNSNVGDGYYKLSVDQDGNGTFEATRTFFRLFGDANGDRKVNDLDVALIVQAYGTNNKNADTNGDGVVNSTDRAYAVQAKGRKLKNGLVVDD